MASVIETGEDASGHRKPTRPRDDGAVVTPEVLANLLGDENTRRVLKAISDEQKGGREIAEAASLSRPTVYRRLNRLEEAGLVETDMVVCSDGHHHKQYRAVLESASFRLDRDGLSVTVRSTSAGSGHGVES